MRGGGESALNRSNAFKRKRLWFKVWTTALGDTAYADDKEVIPRYSETPIPLKDYVGSRYFQEAHQPRAEAMIRTIHAIYADPSKNPYGDVTNQGSAGYEPPPTSDFNRSDAPWQRARLYYWLRKCGELVQPPTGLTVEVLSAQIKAYQTVLINSNAIDAYFKKHPEQLRVTVEMYTAETDRRPPCTPKPTEPATPAKP